MLSEYNVLTTYHGGPCTEITDTYTYLAFVQDKMDHLRSRRWSGAIVKSKNKYNVYVTNI